MGSGLCCHSELCLKEMSQVPARASVFPSVRLPLLSLKPGSPRSWESRNQQLLPEGGRGWVRSKRPCIWGGRRGETLAWRSPAWSPPSPEGTREEAGSSPHAAESKFFLTETRPWDLATLQRCQFDLSCQVRICRFRSDCRWVSLVSFLLSLLLCPLSVSPGSFQSFCLFCTPSLHHPLHPLGKIKVSFSRPEGF